MQCLCMEYYQHLDNWFCDSKPNIKYSYTGQWNYRLCGIQWSKCYDYCWFWRLYRFNRHL